MTKPDSLLTACKKVAAIAGVPWKKANNIYRALQAQGTAGPFLPVSSGRSVWIAERNLIARFVIALATSDHHDDAYRNTLRFLFYSRNGDGRCSGDSQGTWWHDPDTMGAVIARAMYLDARPIEITFELDESPSRVVVRDDNGMTAFYINNPSRDWLPEEYTFSEDANGEAVIRRSIQIAPQFFSRVAAEVAFGTGAPVRAQDDSDPNEESAPSE